MNYINSCLDGLTFYRGEDKQGYTQYIAKIHNMTGMGRYIIASVPSHLGILSKAQIHELPWICIQARTLKKGYNVKSQNWNFPRNVKDKLIKIVKRTQMFSEYSNPDLDCEIILLHNPKKRTIYQYHDKLSLQSALSEANIVLNYTASNSDYEFI